MGTIAGGSSGGGGSGGGSTITASPVGAAILYWQSTTAQYDTVSAQATGKRFLVRATSTIYGQTSGWTPVIQVALQLSSAAARAQCRAIYNVAAPASNFSGLGASNGGTTADFFASSVVQVTHFAGSATSFVNDYGVKTQNFGNYGNTQQYYGLNINVEWTVDFAASGTYTFTQGWQSDLSTHSLNASYRQVTVTVVES
jgi:hypothetical protein